MWSGGDTHVSEGCFFRSEQVFPLFKMPPVNLSSLIVFVVFCEKTPDRVTQIWGMDIVIKESIFM